MSIEQEVDREKKDIALETLPVGEQRRDVTILSMSWSFIRWMPGSIVGAGNLHEETCA